jgi:hypothetical protein
MRYAVCALLFVAACGGKKAADAPSCEKVVDAMLNVTKQAMPNHGDMEMGNKKQMVAECERRNLSDDQKRCIVGAKDLTALATCTPKPAAPK